MDENEHNIHVADDPAPPSAEQSILDPVAEPAPPSASARLRAFEDVHLGKTAVRLHGRIERGFGSPFKAMLPEKHQHYAALEKLVTTEQALSDARGALLAAEAAHEAATADAAKFED